MTKVSKASKTAKANMQPPAHVLQYQVVWQVKTLSTDGLLQTPTGDYGEDILDDDFMTIHDAWVAIRDYLMDKHAPLNGDSKYSIPSSFVVIQVIRVLVSEVK